MKKRWSYIQSRAGSDSADSTVITSVMVWPLLIMMLITMIEIPILFENRSVLQNDLRSGAKVAATLGGVNTVSSKLAATYGAADACSHLTSTAKAIMKSGWRSTDAVTCATASIIASNKTYIGLTIYDLTCGPSVTETVGAATYCEAKYNYTGIPGGSMSLIGGTQHLGYGTGDITTIQSTDGHGHSGSGIQYGHIRMSDQSEVCLGASCTE